MERVLTGPLAPLVVLADGASPARAVRTERALRSFGLGPETVPAAGLAAALAARRGRPAWLVTAGCWPRAVPEPPPASATGRPLIAIGAVDEHGTPERGGDFGSEVPEGVRLASACLEPGAAAALAAALEREPDLGAALRRVARELRARVVSWPALDLRDDARLRVAQVVTSLQQGGAERVALALHAALEGLGVSGSLLVLGSATRAELVLPPGAPAPLRLPRLPTRAARAELMCQLLARDGADVVHGHLLEDFETSALGRLGIPTVVTVHNQRAGWPLGLAGAVGRPEGSVLVACCRAVEDELRAARVMAPLRTVWNGIDPRSVADGAHEGAALRARLAIPSGALLVLSLANPRPQKRVPLLPAILAAVARELPGRAAVLVLAGSPGRGSAAAQQELAHMREQARALGVAARVLEVGSLAAPGAMLRAADVLVCCSAWEGLSLAWLEALACGTPVVSADVGGAAEVARLYEGMRLVPASAPPERYAAAIVASVTAARPRGTVLLSWERMAGGYARVYEQAACARVPGSGVWLVTNNLATGGAQSSARRLLVGLAARGVRVRATVVEEQDELPSPGSTALRGRDIPVHVAAASSSAQAALGICRALAADRPAAVLLWNLRPALRVLLADALFATRVFDVSPGAMWFESLRAWFARPSPELPYRSTLEYGARLAGAVVKHAAEAREAERMLGTEVHVIRNGVESVAPREGPRAPGPLRIGTLARLSPQKRLEDLLAAFGAAHARFPRCELHVGGGPERGTAEYAAGLRERAVGVPVVWHGEVDAGAFLRGLDLFAMVSEPAGCPNASLEAMAHGLAVVATDAGGAREQVVDGVTGRLVPRGDTAALADALVALASDAAARARMGDAGRARVEERFTAERMVADYARLLGIERAAEAPCDSRRAGS